MNLILKCGTELELFLVVTRSLRQALSVEFSLLHLKSKVKLHLGVQTLEVYKIFFNVLDGKFPLNVMSSEVFESMRSWFIPFQENQVSISTRSGKADGIF